MVYFMPQQIFRRKDFVVYILSIVEKIGNTV